MTDFVFRVSMSKSSKEPTLVDADKNKVAHVKIPYGELTAVQLALQNERVSVGAPGGECDAFVAAAYDLIANLDLANVDSFLCNGSRPYGNYWQLVAETYLHPIDGDGAVCVSKRTISGKPQWIMLRILAEPS